MAGELLMGISQDERERAIFRSRRMYQSDQESNLRTAMYNARNEGRVEGRVKGRAEGRAEGFESGLEKGREALLETARNALAKGLPVGLIQEITGLDEKTIKSLHEENR